MEKEYLMLRAEMDECLKKQDSVFTIIISILGLSNVFIDKFENIPIMFLLLFLTTLLQLRILEYRNTVYYISTYMVSFLEKTLEFKWETRLKDFKKGGYELKGDNIKNKIINILGIRLGKMLKHFSILALIGFIIYKLIININTIYYPMWIKIILFIVIWVFAIFNLIYAYALCSDKVNYQEYLNRWEKIKEKEEKTR